MGFTFSYFQRHDEEQFTWFRIPRLLITDRHFAGLPSDCKILYGLMLDRMRLSEKNGWYDAENRIYIYYTIEDVMADLNCCRQTAVRLFKYLDSGIGKVGTTPIQGVGLIERKRLPNKPTRIYVKNFMDILKADTGQPPGDECEQPDNLKTDTQEKIEESPQSTKQKNTSSCSQNGTGNTVNKRKSTLWTSGSMKSRLPEVYKVDPSKNNNSQTYKSQNESETRNAKRSSFLQVSETEREKRRKTMFPESRSETEQKAGNQPDKSNWSEDLLKKVKEQIGYVTLCQRRGSQAAMTDLIVLTIAETIYRASRQRTFRIAGIDYPAEVVCKKFNNLDMGQVESVLTGFSEVRDNIKNPKAYLRTMLFNASDNMVIAEYQNETVMNSRRAQMIAKIRIASGQKYPLEELAAMPSGQLAEILSRTDGSNETATSADSRKTEAEAGVKPAISTKTAGHYSERQELCNTPILMASDSAYVGQMDFPGYTKGFTQNCGKTGIRIGIRSG